MFGARYFGHRMFGPAYFGDGSDTPPAAPTHRFTHPIVAPGFTRPVAEEDFSDDGS